MGQKQLAGLQFDELLPRLPQTGRSKLDLAETCMLTMIH
jgi:hypothetical protein